MMLKLSLLMRQMARLVGLVVLMAAVVALVDVHREMLDIRATQTLRRQILQSVADAADNIVTASEKSADVSDQTLDLLGSSTKLVDHATKAVDLAQTIFPQVSLTLDHANASLDSATATIGKAGTVADTLSREVPHVSQSLVSSLAGVPSATLAAQHSFEAISAVASDPNIPLVISHVEGTAAGADAAMQSVAHTAAFYEHEITGPKRWWIHLRDTATAGAVWSARHL